MAVNKLNEKRSDIIDIRYLIQVITNYWLLIGACIFISLCITYLINKTKPLVFKVTGSVVVSSETSNLAKATSDLMEGMGMFSADKNFTNELQLLSSSPLVREALTKLNFMVSYYQHNRLSTRELYKSSPFIVIVNQRHPQPINQRIYIEYINNSTFNLIIKSEDIELFSYYSNQIIGELDKLEYSGVKKFGEQITSDYYDFKVVLNDKYQIEDYKSKKFSFIFHSIGNLVFDYRSRLEILPVDLKATVAEISLTTSVPDKAIDFINSLCESYLSNSLDKKNHMSIKTIEYIDGQLNIIKDSLSIAENKLQDFRSRNKIVDISMQSGKVFDELRELEKEKADLLVKYKYYNYIDDYFEQNQEYSDLITPSGMGITDPLLNNMIEELIKLNAEKVTFIENNQEKSPYLRKIDIRIENLRNMITENISYIKNTSQIAIKEVQSRINQLNQEIQKLPGTEKELLGIERKFNINDAIYTYLLQRRTEAEIARASHLADAEILEPPNIVGNTPIAPKKRVNYMIAIFLGFIIPIGFIQIKEILRKNFKTKEEISSVLDLPVLGNIYNNNKKVNIVVKSFPKSHITESFRRMRFALNFFLSFEQSKMLVLTSSISAEGKSFISLNTAITLAISGCKTILIGFDLRKPMLYERVGIKEIAGASAFLSRQAELDEIIQSTNIENLDVIWAGDIPPNPGGLIASNRAKELFNSLRERYEYIIIDTAPIGIVSDGLHLLSQADLIIFVARINHTPIKESIQLINELKEQNFENLALVINDVPLHKKGRYGYGYYDIEN